MLQTHLAGKLAFQRRGLVSWKLCEVKQHPARLVSGWGSALLRVRSNHARYVTFGGSSGMKTFAELELPYPQSISQAKIRDESSRRGK